MNFEKIQPWITPGLLLIFGLYLFFKPAEGYKMDPETRKQLQEIDSKLDSLKKRPDYKQKILIIHNETKQKLSTLDTLRDSVAVSRLFSELDSALNEYKRQLDN